jgi:hypothetical protein
VWGCESEKFYFSQTADIDATETREWTISDTWGTRPAGFVAIGRPTFDTSGYMIPRPFMGIYDGNDFAIIGLYSVPFFGYATVGLFSMTSDALIKNVHLVDAEFWQGQFIYSAAYTTILNCHVSGVFRACWATGFIHTATHSHIEFCSSSANVVLDCAQDTVHPMAGLIHKLKHSTLKNSFYHGKLTMNGSGFFAGLVMMAVGSEIKYCYATATDDSDAFYYGIISTDREYFEPVTPSTIELNLWDITTTQTTVAGPVTAGQNFGLPTYQMLQADTYIDIGWDFGAIWAIDPEINSGYPYHQGNVRYLDPRTNDTDTTIPVVPSMRSIAYPNPASSQDVTFRANLVRPQMEISIYNVRGQLIRRATDFTKVDSESSFVWDRKNERGQPVAPGIYLYRIKTDTQATAGKILIVK